MDILRAEGKLLQKHWVKISRAKKAEASGRNHGYTNDLPQETEDLVNLKYEEATAFPGLAVVEGTMAGNADNRDRSFVRVYFFGRLSIFQRRQWHLAASWYFPPSREGSAKSVGSM